MPRSEKPSHSDLGRRLREQRNVRHVSLAEMASKLGCSRSYISAIELGHDTPSAELLRNYAEALQLPLDTFLDALPHQASDHDGFVAGVLEVVHRGPNSRGSLTDDPWKPLPIEHEESIAPFREVPKPEMVLEEVLRLLTSAAQAQALPKEEDDKNIVFVRQGRNILDHRPRLRDALHDALRGALERGWHISKYVRPDTDDDSNRALFKEIIEESVAFAHLGPHAGQYRPYYFSSRGLKRIPYGFLIVPTIGTLFTLSTLKFNEVDAALYFAASPQVLHEHCRLLVLQAKRPLEIYQDDPALDFPNELVAAEESDGDRLMAQPFFSSVTRAPSEFRKGTAWGDRHRGRRLETRIRKSLRRYRAMEEQLLKRVHFKQICSKRVLSHWREYGHRLGSSKYGQRTYFEGDAERLSRLQNTVELLKRHDNFEIALLDADEEDTFLGWSDKNDTAWMIKGSSILIESWYRSNGESKDLRIVISDPLIAGDFQQHFSSLWKRISPKNKDKVNVIKWLNDEIDKLTKAAQK